MSKKHADMINEVEAFITEEGETPSSEIILSIRDMDYVKRKRKVENLKLDLFGI